MKFIFLRTIKILLTISQFSPFALVWMIKAFLIDWPLSKWSLYRFPAKAKEMGLHHVQSEYIREFGSITGTLHGYKIEIKPDEHMNSSIRISALYKEEDLEISLSRSPLRPGKNTGEFTTPNWKFNQTFKTKRANLNRIGILSNNTDFFDLLLSFYTRWIFNIDAITVEHGEIYCKFTYGFYFFPYIPVYRIRDIVSQLIAIAQKHDTQFNR